jgi:TonB family protein
MSIKLHLVTLDTFPPGESVDTVVEEMFPLSIRRACRLIVAAGACAALFSPVGMAQKTDHAERKILSKVSPAYPDLAKRMHVGGVVKVEVVVRSNGSVKSARALGGNPVLIESATEAVHKWKFETAAAETTEVLQLTFEAH